MRSALAARFRPGDHRREKNARREKRGDHPEQSQLEMPGAGEVVRKQPGQVIPEEATRLRVVVRGRTAE